jgi:hypothetical protein
VPNGVVHAPCSRPPPTSIEGNSTGTERHVQFKNSSAEDF